MIRLANWSSSHSCIYVSLYLCIILYMCLYACVYVSLCLCLHPYSCFLINSADRIIRVYESGEVLACGRDGEPEPIQKLQDLVNRCLNILLIKQIWCYFIKC